MQTTARSPKQKGIIKKEPLAGVAARDSRSLTPYQIKRAQSNADGFLNFLFIVLSILGLSILLICAAEPTKPALPAKHPASAVVANPSSAVPGGEEIASVEYRWVEGVEVAHD